MRAPKGLAARGRRLWAGAWKVKPGLSPAEVVLLEEACRVVDRLDRLAAVLAGETRAWAELDWPGEGSPAVLVVSSAVSEARQHAALLRQLLTTLDLPAEARVEVSGLDELAARRSTGRSA